MVILKTGSRNFLVNWDKHFLDVAKLISTRSKDPSSQVGAVAVGDKRQILATGYNGFPRGIKDCEKRLAHRETKYKYICHAEVNLIYNACYTGVSLDQSTLYVYGLPLCSECCKGIIQVGISEVVMSFPPDNKWLDSFSLTKELLNEVGIKHKVYHEPI